MALQFNTYIGGTKTIKAMPMTVSEAKTYGANVTEDFIRENLGKDGYLMEYPDGYRSWRPAKEFQYCYCLSEETYIEDRLNVELSELVSRLNETAKEAYLCVSPDNKDRELILKQVRVMNEYAEILNLRILNQILIKKENNNGN